MMRKQKQKEPFDMREFMRGPRKWFVIVPGSLLVVALGWFAYFKLTVMTPPDVKTVSPEDMVAYLGDSRGLIQQPVDRREQIELQMWERFRNAPREEQTRMARSFQSMSPAQRENFVRANAGIMKKHTMRLAEEFNQTPPSQRAQFAQQALQKLDRMGAALAGGGPNGTGVDTGVGQILSSAAPKSADELQKVLITETTPGERTKAEPLVHEMAKSRKAQQLAEASRNH